MMRFLLGARPLISTALLATLAMIAVISFPTQAPAQGRGRGKAAQAAPSAQPAPQQGGGGWRGARGMDRNGDGKIDLSEVPDFLRGRFEATVREAGLDPKQGISVDRYDELSRQRFAQGGGFGGPGRDARRDEGQPQASPNGQAATETRLVPGFGNEFEESPVANFGELKDEDGWQHDYDPSVIAAARDIIARYDTNKNGVLERSEWKAVQWRNDPNQSDRNKDGKLDLKEMVERLAAQGKEDHSRSQLGGGQFAFSVGGASAAAAAGAANPASGGQPGSGRRAGGPRGGADAFWHALDKNGNGRLDREELASAPWAQQGVRQAGFDPEKGVGLQEFLDARAKSAGGGGRFRMGGGPGGGLFTGGGGMAFGNPTAGFGTGDSGDAGMDISDSGGSGDAASEGRKTGRGNRAAAAASKPGAKKADGTTAANYRFQTSQELLPKDLPAWFLSKDKNGDGQVSMAEFSSTWSDSEVARFKQYDLNNDGIITAAEVMAKSGRATSREESDSTASDESASDSEGSTSATETRAESPAETKPVSSSTPAPAAAEAPAGKPSASHLEQAKRYMKLYDKNHNGVLEIDEWWTSKLLRAKDVDANGDEKITEEELIQYFQKRFPDR